MLLPEIEVLVLDLRVLPLLDIEVLLLEPGIVLLDAEVLLFELRVLLLDVEVLLLE